MKYKRTTDLLLSAGVMNFSTDEELNAASVISVLLADDRFTGVIKLSDSSAKKRAGVLVRSGQCIAGFIHGANLGMQAFNHDTVQSCIKMSKLKDCTYEAYLVTEPKVVALSSIFRGYPDKPYKGPKFLDMLKLKTDFCEEKELTACLSIVTPVCTSLILIHLGKQLGLYIPEQQSWVEKMDVISEFLTAAAPHSSLELTILSPKALSSSDFSIPWK